jgi:SPP1 family predicted phage head-tail adaptor
MLGVTRFDQRKFGAGKLDRRIELQSATITNDPDNNEEIQTWATYATVWAWMQFHKSDEGEAASREYAEMGLYFTIRWRSDVSAEHRVVYEGENYEIIGRPREIGRRQWLKIHARLVE